MSGLPRIPHLGAALVAAATVVPIPAARAQIMPEPESSCIGCHQSYWSAALRAPVELVPQSVHGAEGIDCTGCHGGRPDVETVAAHDPEADFRPAPSHAEVAELCGSCHEQHGEQVAEWLSSRHASSFISGGPGASCLDCHGAHGIQAVEDPGSLANPSRVVETCGGCHADPVRIGPTDLPLDITRAYTGSVHGLARVRGVDEAPTCIGCHDPHEGAAGLDAVSACGECHEEADEAYEAGPHATAYASRGFLACVECHGSHGIERAGFTLVASARDGACRRCHAPGEETFADVQRIARLVTTADLAMAEAGFGEDAETGAEPVPGSALARARADLVDAVHRMDVEALEAATRTVVAVAGDAAKVDGEGRPANPSPTSAEPSGCALGGRVPAALTVLGIPIAGVLLVRRPRGPGGRRR